jgi:hypothetical protein
METQSDTLKEVLAELFALLEAQETNSVAVLQLLKDQGITSDETLAPYLDQAGRASNVKWRAARMRMEYLLTPIKKETADNDKSIEAQPKAARNKADEDEGENQAKDNGNEKEQARTEAKSAGKADAEKSSDEKQDANNGAAKGDQNAASKQTA